MNEKANIGLCILFEGKLTGFRIQFDLFFVVSKLLELGDQVKNQQLDLVTCCK